MKKYVFCCLLLSTMPAYSENVTTINDVEDIKQVELPIDTAALNFAIKKISNTDVLKDVIYTNILSQETLTVDALFRACVSIADSIRECAQFVNEYVNILTNRSNCMKANNFTIHDFYNKKVTSKIQISSIQECYSRTTINDYVEGSIVDQCKQWIEVAEKCQIYLTYYYQDKLSSPDITQKDQKKYRCILNKIQTGNVDFPTSKMENDCK